MAKTKRSGNSKSEINKIEVKNEKVISGKEVVQSSVEIQSDVSVDYESFWQRYRSVIFEAMKSIQILVCLAYCLFFVMAVVSKKEWLNAYHDNIRLQIYGLSIYWYESGVYFFISGIGLIGAVGEVLCCCILYSIFHTIAVPYCIIPWFVTIGIYNGWGWTKMYIDVCNNFNKLIQDL